MYRTSRVTFFSTAFILAVGVFFFSVPSAASAFVVGLGPQAHTGGMNDSGKAFIKELQPHSLRIGYHDTANINWAVQNGFQVMGGFGYGDGCNVQTPAGRQCYADRSARAAVELGNKVQTYGVWNEWNGGLGLPCGYDAPPCNDAAMYTDLLCRTYKAVKAVRPSTRIAGGVLAGGNVDFLGRMLDAGAGNCMDVVDMHLYPYRQTLGGHVAPNAPGSVGADRVLRMLSDTNRIVIQKTGRSIPIIMSETGFTGGDSAWEEALDAEYLTALYNKAKTIPYIEGIWWFQLREHNRARGGISVFGLVRNNNTKKPSFFAFKAVANNTTPPPSDTTPPSTPASLTATPVSASQINLSWNASTDTGGSGLLGYRVERCQGSGCTNFTQIATPTPHSFSNTGLTANTLYRYRVRAVDGTNNLSPFSAIATATTQTGSTPTLCHTLTPPNSTIPSGFAPPWNVFTNTLTSKVDCQQNNTVLFTLGDTLSTTYIWKSGHYTKNGQAWEPAITFTGSTPSSDNNWFIGSAHFTPPPLTAPQIATQNFVVGYLCSFQSNQWKCGCTHSTSCTANGLWGIQGFKQ